MSPSPIASGDILQNRFRIVQILGQGGFGRTYLALDEQRFNEQCAIKEYIPIKGDDYTLSKSKELFQREAATLYQIKHPQIPGFRALFEEHARLFFVQDFIQGKPYSHLLQERLNQGVAFSEGEVLQFLEHILPVISYIHSQNLVHRDISPDNLILRDSDRLPVLIDFGVVKLTELEKSLAPQGTVVGKSGYSPIEQLKMGKTYPSSDLYALAVTVLVLLTGKHPEYLFDEMTCSWQWSRYLPHLSLQLVAILEKMLSDRPQHRYQSADAVLAAIKPLLQQVQLASTDLTIVYPPQQPPSSGAVPSNPPKNSRSKNSRSPAFTVPPTKPEPSSYPPQGFNPSSQIPTVITSKSPSNPPSKSPSKAQPDSAIAKTRGLSSLSSYPAPTTYNLPIWIACISAGITTLILLVLFFASLVPKYKPENSATISVPSEAITPTSPTPTISTGAIATPTQKSTTAPTSKAVPPKANVANVTATPTTKSTPPPSPATTETPPPATVAAQANTQTLTTAPPPPVVPTPIPPSTPANAQTSNSSYVVSDRIIPNQILRFNLEGSPGNGISIRLLSGNLSKISILHPDGSAPPKDPNLLTGSGRYFFPYAGTYTITVQSNEATNFSFEISSIKGNAPARPMQ